MPYERKWVGKLIKILKLIKKIEKEKDIKVIFAVESGSRVWGFASKDSDYDIRCIHVSPVRKYFSINEPPQQIESLNEIPGIDIVSWDIKKFCKLFYNSNPSCSEWLNSDIIYIDSKYREQLKKIFQKDFSRYALKKHYISMGRQNYEKYIRNRETCSLKKYVYILRALACVEWLEHKDEIPPIKWDNVYKILPEKLRIFFEKVVELKKESESLEEPPNKEVNSEIEKYFDIEFEKDKNKFDSKIIDRIMRTVITLQEN